VVFGGSPMAVYRIMSVRMQAFAEGTFRLLPTTYREPKNNAIPNEKRINLPPTFNALSTRHWPVFSDQARFIIGNGARIVQALACGMSMTAEGHDCSPCTLPPSDSPAQEERDLH
jgi:hypothetical protein